MAKTPGVALSEADLLRHLDEQIGFLVASADAFDSGFEGEAKRLATTIRILVHDTSSSHSLLGQLERKGGAFISTSFEFDPKNQLTHGGLVAIAMGGSAAGKFLAQLDDMPVTRHLTFDEWWEEPVFVDQQRRVLTRRQVVLTAANQDGGAHVDPRLDSVYADLSKNNSLGWIVSDGVSILPMNFPERACIRQIAHELLKSILPDYGKQPLPADAGAITMGWSLTVADKPFTKVGRNDPCPCGSGKKFKKCHGR